MDALLKFERDLEKSIKISRPLYLYRITTILEASWSAIFALSSFSTSRGLEILDQFWYFLVTLMKRIFFINNTTFSRVENSFVEFLISFAASDPTGAFSLKRFQLLRNPVLHSAAFLRYCWPTWYI